MAYEVNRKLCERLSVDKDPDVEMIINDMFDIIQMGMCGVAETFKDSEIHMDELESNYQRDKYYLNPKDYGSAINELENIPDYKA